MHSGHSWLCLFVKFWSSNGFRLMLSRCSVNFPEAQCCLFINNFVSLTLCQTTTSPPKTSVALMNRNLFLGWVIKDTDKNQLQKRLENGKLLGRSCIRRGNFLMGCRRGDMLLWMGDYHHIFYISYCCVASNLRSHWLTAKWSTKAYMKSFCCA